MIRHFMATLLFLLLLNILGSCTIWPGFTTIVTNRDQKDGNSSMLELALLAQLLQASSSSCRDTGKCAIFVTSGAWTPGGGIAAADAFCQGESGTAAPAAPGTYKALLMTENGTRDATHGWVLYPNLCYYTLSNGTGEIGCTDATATFPAGLPTMSIGSAGVSVWTGINTSPSPWQPVSSTTCTSWTNASGGSGEFGSDTFVSSAAFMNGASACTTLTNHLYCVQQ